MNTDIRQQAKHAVDTYLTLLDTIEYSNIDTLHTQLTATMTRLNQALTTQERVIEHHRKANLEAQLEHQHTWQHTEQQFIHWAPYYSQHHRISRHMWKHAGVPDRVLTQLDIPNSRTSGTT